MAKDKDTEAPEGGKKSKKKLIMIGALCVVIAGAGYKLGGGGKATAVAVPTTIVQLEGCKEGTDATHADPNPIDLPKMNLNLADGHFLSVAVSLNLCPDVVVKDPAKWPAAPAKDIVVSTLSGASMAVLSTPEGREEARELLTAKLRETYHEEVYEVFFSEFVMQ
jgi:flagellar FliL protein